MPSNSSELYCTKVKSLHLIRNWFNYPIRWKNLMVLLKYIFAKIMSGVSTHGEFLKFTLVCIFQSINDI